MSWRAYESYIAEHLRRAYPGAALEVDQRLSGIVSGISRQVDILVEGKIAGFEMRIIVECKCYSSRIDVKDVEAFLGVLADLKASKGVMITTVGYTAGAMKRARGDTRDVELNILDFEDLASFYGTGGGIAYRGPHGVLFSCPSGWSIHPVQGGEPVPVCFAKCGVSSSEAWRTREVMYLDFSTKAKFVTLDALLAEQERKTRLRFPDCVVSRGGFVPNVISAAQGYETILRTIRFSGYSEVEHTAFLQFEEFFAFFVLFTPKADEDANLKKLRFMVKQALPVQKIITA